MPGSSETSSGGILRAEDEVHVWVPYPEMVTDLTASSPRIRASLFDGRTPPPDVDRLEFVVPPYNLGARGLQLALDAPRLRVVQLLTAGYERVAPLIPDGVVLCNARGVHDASTAELAVALILASLRGIPDFVLAQQEGAWRHETYPALADRTVLILGYGSIGEALERRLLPFEVDLIRVARRTRPGVHAVNDLPALLPRADVVVVLTPLTEQTFHLVDRDFLARMRPGALLVNVARGAVVDTEALVEAVRGGRVRAALDVTDPEPLPPDHPLWQLPGVLISPHVGGDTTAFLPRARKLVVDQVFRYLNGEPLRNVVNGEEAPRPAE